MSDASAEEFLGRVMEHLKDMPRDKYSNTSWRYEGRPTGEGVGLKPGVELDVDKVVQRVLDVENYADNIKFVESCTISNKISDSEIVYVQRMKLPVIGKVQVSLHIEDLGERDGYRVVAWDQDDPGTMALDKHQGIRTEYNLGAWLIKTDELAFALSSAPIKKDVGSLKYALMTKGADATSGTAISTNIDAMVAWSHRD